MTQAKIDVTLSDQVAALERELVALREQSATASAEELRYLRIRAGQYEDMYQRERRAEDILRAGNYENIDHAAARVVKQRDEAMRELASLRASPSPSAGAVPEVTPGTAIRNGEFVSSIGINGRPVVTSFDNSFSAADVAGALSEWLRAHWPKPHADAGGEVIRLREERNHFCDAYHRECERALARRAVGRQGRGMVANGNDDAAQGR